MDTSETVRARLKKAKDREARAKCKAELAELEALSSCDGQRPFLIDGKIATEEQIKWALDLADRLTREANQ